MREGNYPANSSTHVFFKSMIRDFVCNNVQKLEKKHNNTKFCKRDPAHLPGSENDFQKRFNQDPALLVKHSLFFLHFFFF